MNNHQFRVIGIAPEGFKGTEMVYTPEIWLPASMMEWVEPGATWIDDRNTKNFFAVGRLKAGVSARQAEASLNLLANNSERVSRNQRRTIDQVGPPGFIIPDLRGAVVSFTWVLMAAVVWCCWLRAQTWPDSCLRARRIDAERSRSVWRWARTVCVSCGNC